MQKYLFTCIAFFTGISASVAGTLNVTVKNINNTKGQIITAIYNKEDGFPKAEDKYKAAKSKPILSNTITTSFTNLPAGKYAVVSFHDANDNGKLDKNWLGMPTEQYGFSNGATKPDFKQSAIVIKANETKSVTITLNDA